jgi:hypothetical protein
MDGRHGRDRSHRSNRQHPGLVVFGKNHIVMWADKAGSEIGLDPTALEVVDTIEGTGCIARDSVAVTGEGDIISTVSRTRYRVQV